MPFHPLSTLPEMQSIYRLPRSPERFSCYLTLLQGDSNGDLLLPIGGFNPMANDFAAGRLDELIALDAAGILGTELSRLNALPAARGIPNIGVGLNLADDVGGTWTNRYTTDYTSKFTLHALISRNFCAPFFWTSEAFTPDLFSSRIREYVLRTIYCCQHGQPLTLANHVAQEVYVRHLAFTDRPDDEAEIPAHLVNYFAQYQTSSDYHVIFAFLYGDAAAESLGFKTFGVARGYLGD